MARKSHRNKNIYSCFGNTAAILSLQRLLRSTFTFKEKHIFVPSPQNSKFHCKQPLTKRFSPRGSFVKTRGPPAIQTRCASQCQKAPFVRFPSEPSFPPGKSNHNETLHRRSPRASWSLRHNNLSSSKSITADRSNPIIYPRH